VWTTRFGDKKVQFAIPPRHTKQDVEYLKELVEWVKFRAVVEPLLANAAGGGGVALRRNRAEGGQRDPHDRQTLGN
jgi:hypothetical protein